jgi:hypothetical protein
MREQLRILQEIQEGGHNVVTCGMCGFVLLVYTDESMNRCVKCDYIEEGFPDIVSVSDIELLHQEPVQYTDDMHDDADALASAGHGTDEDYGYYGEEY